MSAIKEHGYEPASSSRLATPRLVLADDDFHEQLAEVGMGVNAREREVFSMLGANWPRTVNMMDSNAASSGNFQDVLADVGMGNREPINAKQAPVPRRSAAPHSPYPAALRRGASRPRAAVHVSRRGSILIEAD